MALTKQQLLDLIILKLADESTITADEHRTVENAIVDAIFADKSQIGDIKEIACNNQYILDNFETGTSNIIEGKGIVNGERYGWAICNGKNGTVDKRGNVSIGYDPVNGYQLTSPGANGPVGGTKTVTLDVTQIPPHSHSVIPYAGNTGTNNNAHINSSTNGASYDKTGITGGLAGVTVPHNNMQPYIVTLFIQRIQV